jgi:hypothetical protein
VGVKRQTQRKLAVGVLVLACGAFCVDRFVLGYSGPQTAAAATAASAGSAEAPKPRAVQSAAIVDSGPEVSVSRRLAALKGRMPSWGPRDEQDAMTIPASWHIDLPAAEEKAAGTSAPVSRLQAPKFALSTVMGDSKGQSYLAIINGRTVKVGDQIEGYTVESIKGSKESAAVVLSGPGGEFTIESPRMDPALAESMKAEIARPESVKSARGKR